MTLPVLTGRFGKLVIIGPAPRSGGGHVQYRCRCDCGEITVTHAARLRSGNTTSCGCHKRSVRGNANRTHGEGRPGLTQTKEHHIWIGMLRRCNNKRDHAYLRYGGRGIKVCDRWSGRQGYANFLADMGRCPSGMTLERKRVNEGYSLENCIWATRTAQARNRRSNKIVEYRGKKYVQAALVEKFGLTRETFSKRLRLGWPVEKAVETPLRGSL